MAGRGRGMREKDYIAATNLAKVRIAVDVLRDVIPDDGTIDSEALAVIVARLVRWRIALEKKVIS